MKLSRYLTLVLILVSVIFIVGCNQKSENGLNAQQVEIPVELTLKIGETAKISDTEVTVISAQKSKSFEYYSAYDKKDVKETVLPGQISILVEAEIKNIGAESNFLGSENFSAVNSEGHPFKPALYHGSDELASIAEIEPDQEIKGKFVFILPETSEGWKIQYDFGDVNSKTKLASWPVE